MANTTSLTGLSKDILREKYILEGFQFYLETFHPEHNNLLLESNNKDILLEGIFSKVLDKISSFTEKNKVRDFFYNLGYLFKLESSPEFKKRFQEAADAVKKYNLTPQQILQAVKGKKINEETQDDDVYKIAVSDEQGNEKTFDLRNTISASDVDFIRVNDDSLYRDRIEDNVDSKTGIYTPPDFNAQEKEASKGIQIIQSFGDWLNKNVVGKVFKGALVTLVALSSIAMPVIKIDRAADYAETENFRVDNILNKGLQDTNTPESNQALDAASKVNVNIDGKPLSSLSNEPNTVVKFIPFDYGKGMKASSAGEKIMADTFDSIKKLAQENPNAEITIKVTGHVTNSTGDVKLGSDTKLDLDQARLKITADKAKAEFKDYPNVKVVEKPNPSDSYKTQTKITDKAGGKGGAGASMEIELSGKAKLVPPPEFQESGSWNIMPPSNPKEPKTSKGNTNTTTTITPIPPVAGDDFSKLNRNGQIATVLASINPKLNIAQYKEIGPIKSYTDNELLNPNIKNAKAKELARLIVTIRKNPNSLLTKVSKATGIPFNVRAKAISTQASKSTQAQLQSPTVKETQELFQEALVDDIFTKLGIQDSDLAKNKIKLAGYLGSMYAKEGDTDLSILDTDKLSDDDKKELQKVGFGFTPQSGKNYVFLKGQSKADVKKQVKVQADTTRVLNTINRNTSLKTSLKRINTRDELKELIKAIIGYINNRLKQTPGQIKTDLITIRNTYKAPNKPLKEEEKALNLPDINNAVKLIDSYSGLKTELDRINTREELVQLLKGIIAFLDPALASRETDVKAAFQGAASSITNKALEPWKGDGKNKKNPPPTPTTPTTEIKRMQELAGLKTR